MNDKMKFLLPYWRKGIIPVVFLLISTIISFVYPLFPRWAIDNVVMQQRHDKLLYIAIIFLGLIILQRVFLYLNEVTFFKFQKKCILDIQQKLLSKIFFYPMDFFDKNHSGYLMGRIRGDVTGLSYIFSQGLVLVVMDFIKFIGVIIIIFILNVKLSLIILTILPVIVIKIINSQKDIKEINKHIIEENARLEESLSDTLQGIEVLKSFSKEKEGIERTGSALKKYQKFEIKRTIILSKYNNIVDFIVHVGEVLFLYFGVQEIVSGKLTIGSYIAFSGYLIFLYSPIKNISQLFVFMDFARRSYFRIKELFDILPEDSGEQIIDEIKLIEIKDIYFDYDKKDNLIKGLTYKFNKGKKYVLTGVSGKGKSTLIKILLGLYRPKKGAVFYNDTNLKDINIKRLREKVGYISQNIFLFNKSLRENIVFDNNIISDKEIFQILKICELDQKINQLKEGLNTIVSEKGANFSGGERQKIALSRALIKKPDLIILDEGTSNIDSVTENKILKTIEENFKDRIIIRITHRNIQKEGWSEISL